VGLAGGGLRSRSDCLQFSCWYRDFVDVRGEQGDGSQDTLMPWLVFWVDGKRLPGGGRGGLCGLRGAVRGIGNMWTVVGSQ